MERVEDKKGTWEAVLVWIRIIFASWIRICVQNVDPDQGGKFFAQKLTNLLVFSCDKGLSSYPQQLKWEIYFTS
jgi:hypothetical protein